MINNLQMLLQNPDSGFALANSVVLEDLQKALSAGYGTDAASFTGGRAIQPESLDMTLVSVLHSQEDAKLFKLLKKEPVSSTVHQYTKRTEVGSDDAAYVPEGGDSEETDQDLARKTVNMKYLQTLRKVTLQASTAKTMEDAVALEQNAGTLWLIRNAETHLFKGSSAANVYEPDGLDVLIGAANVIDFHGLAADAANDAFENVLSESCRKIRDFWGKATHLFSSTMVMEDIQKLMRDRIRVPVGTGGDGNYVFDAYPTKFGKPLLEDNVFIQEGHLPSASAYTAKAPGIPTLAAVAQAATVTSNFITGDDGAYVYKVELCNRYGASPVSAEATVAAVAVGQEVKLTVTIGASDGTYVRVYRSLKGGLTGAEVRFAFRVPVTGGGPYVIIDSNNDMPGTSSTYLLNCDPMYDAIEWNQFLPMMKFPLFPTNAAVYPFLMLLFGALNVKKEEQMVRIKNIGYSKGWV